MTREPTPHGQLPHRLLAFLADGPVTYDALIEHLSWRKRQSDPVLETRRRDAVVKTVSRTRKALPRLAPGKRLLTWHDNGRLMIGLVTGDLK